MDAASPFGQPLLLDRITHRYAGHNALNAVTLDIAGGELVALLGPSGCGKTPLLRIVAGLVRQTAGQALTWAVPGRDRHAIGPAPPGARPTQL